MISVFILPSNHFRNWDAQRKELTDAQREKEREKERLTDMQREKDRAIDRDLTFVPIMILRSTALIAIARSVDRDLVKHRADRNLAFAPIAISPSRQSRSRLRDDCDLAKHRADCNLAKHRADRNLAKHRADRSPSSNPVTSLSSFFSQFDRIWWFFFSRFCLYFYIKEWMILYIRLATEKMWENMSNK